MEILNGPVAVIGGLEALNGPVAVVPATVALGDQLAEAVQGAWMKRGKLPPKEFLDLAVAVNQLAAGSAPGSGANTNNGWSGTQAEPRNSPGWQFPACSDQPVMTVTAVARAAEVSATYVRRVVRRGGISSMPRDDQSAPYVLFTESAVAWMTSRRRVVNHRKAA